MSASVSLRTLTDEWLRLDQNEVTRLEIQALLDQDDQLELKKRLVGRIAFGTAGLRAPMGAGFARMNLVTVLQTSQGLAAYLLRKVPEAATKGIVIGRDARHNSFEFASVAAAAFLAYGINVYWYEKLVHTPLVPFAVMHKGAAAGVMVTASHNPAQDNGYKVYWSNGCQIIPPHDQGIAATIMRNLEPVSWKLDVNSPRLSILGFDVAETYFNKVTKLVPWHVQVPSFVYTPMHGVGLPFFTEAIGRMPRGDQDASGSQISMHTVSEQAEPDPDFSTVKFPNPEEKGALDLAIRDATRLRYKLIIANDPDADRLAVAEYISLAGNQTMWRQFTGNEIGILLASYTLELYQTAHKAGNLAMLSSTVSSGMLKAMAEAEGFRFVETLTGFKWLGNVAQHLTAEGYKVAFAFEEALGYMFTDVVWDKDGVSSAVAFLSAASEWSKQGLTPFQKLHQLYEMYGYFADANTYLISPSAETTKLVFDTIRAQGVDHSRPHPASLGEKAIVQWRDLTRGFDTATEDNKPELPVDKDSQMITCELEHGVRFTIRGSGTEPKIKLYVEGRGATLEEAKQNAVVTQRCLIEEWFSPAKYGLKEAA